MTATAAYRDEYRATLVPAAYSGPRHLAVIFMGGLAAIAAAAALLDPVAPLEWLALPATLVYANLAEYAGHRWAMHRRVPGLGLIFKRHVEQHHRFFTEEDLSFDGPADYKAVVFPPLLVAFFFGVFGVPAALLLGWLIAPNVGILFFAGGVAYYLVYEALHFVCHLRDDSAPHRLAVVRAMARHHRRHHDRAIMQTANFNFALPLGDWLFGTLARE